MYKGLEGMSKDRLCECTIALTTTTGCLLGSFDMGDQPTPPHPNDGSGDPEQNPAHPSGAADPSPPVSISSTFHPAANLDHTPPNTLILSSDRILFVVHYRWLYAQSVNLFNGLLLNTVEPTPENPLARSVSERAQVIEILFHAVYNLPFPPHTPTPSLECLEEVIGALHTYGFLPIQRFIATGSPLHTAFVNHAQSKPMEIYALAASRELEDLAVAASPYTLRMSVNRIPAPLVDKMGLQYLLRLYKLHGNRTSRLRSLLDEQPPGIPMHGHHEEHVEAIVRAYQLCGTQVFYSSSPAISRIHIETGMSAFVNTIPCPECKAALVQHVADVCERWSEVPTTI